MDFDRRIRTRVSDDDVAMVRTILTRFADNVREE
jgi:hypothetical protein